MVKIRIPLNIKLLAIEYYKNNNLSYEKVAKIFKINEKTLRRWVKLHNSNNLKIKPQRKQSYKIKEKHVKYALTLLKKIPTLSISMLWSKINEKYNDFCITHGHLSKVIRDNNFTRKRTKIRHYPETRYGKPIDFKKELKAFYKITDTYSLHKIISIDETSIHAQITNTYSRCELGRRCVKKTTKNTVFQKYTLVCAINSKGIVGYELYEKGGMNSQRMIDFINKFIKGKYKNNLIIMDNGGSHKNKKIKESIEETKNRLQYSVPYKPKTNSIENYFNQLKYYFGFEEDKFSFHQLKKAVKLAMKKVKKEHYLNYMEYAYKEKVPLHEIKKDSNRKRKLKTYKK